MTSTLRERLDELIIQIGADGGRFVAEGNMVFTPIVESYRDQIIKLFTDENKKNIGLLRQWLNEKDPKRMVTNEDIETWLLPEKEKLKK